MCCCLCQWWCCLLSTSPRPTMATHYSRPKLLLPQEKLTNKHTVVWPSLGIPVSVGSLERECVHFQSWPQCSNQLQCVAACVSGGVACSVLLQAKQHQPTTAALNSSYPGRNPVPCHRLQPTVLSATLGRACRSTGYRQHAGTGYSRAEYAWHGCFSTA